jgi:hypothetical protein
MAPRTKNGRHINLREHWVRECREGNADVIFAHVQGGLNPSNLQTKIDVAPTFKRESKWHMRGIHGAAYQAQTAEPHRCCIDEAILRLARPDENAGREAQGCSREAF